MSSTVRKSKTAELEIYVWLIEQCDYDDGRDDDGRTRVLDVFAHLDAANKAAEAVFDSQCPDEEPGPDEEEDEVEKSDIKQHLGTNGCYERTYDADQSQGQSRDAYGNFDGCGGFTVSVRRFRLKGVVPVQQSETATRPNATSSTAPTALGEPQAKKRKQADQQM
ncbi:hypothetical protein LTR56_000574 [Elasticomyces elasticus]|nr:hypothetical protein LTR56_000574 [Elasticomyces elasticus]KAK3664350.1 hypothetical protein LTR22_004763 [Elasticomyces elasticus]KAK4915460.1 hypothetical protein LTR49_016448 [Elasticomyces elasticus]KAK5752843.1 hypothetical protein LTS12_017122 [Elasticomyces elasticus]